MGDLLVMSEKEVTRLEVMERVKDKRVSQREAAEIGLLMAADRIEIDLNYFRGARNPRFFHH